MTKDEYLLRVFERLEYLRGEIQNESISYGEILELQQLRVYINDGDIELLQWIDEEY